MSTEKKVASLQKDAEYMVVQTHPITGTGRFDPFIADRRMTVTSIGEATLSFRLVGSERGNRVPLKELALRAKVSNGCYLRIVFPGEDLETVRAEELDWLEECKQKSIASALGYVEWAKQSSVKNITDDF